MRLVAVSSFGTPPWPVPGTTVRVGLGSISGAGRIFTERLRRDFTDLDTLTETGPDTADRGTWTRRRRVEVPGLTATRRSSRRPTEPWKVTLVTPPRYRPSMRAVEPPRRRLRDAQAVTQRTFLITGEEM